MSKGSLITRFKEAFNGSVILTFANYSFKLIFKFLLLIFVPIFLDKATMGYWYTFASVAALATLADLGFTTIVTQFAAHEAVYLDFNKKSRTFNDDDEKLGRISSLFRFSVKWSGILTFLCSAIILVVGIFVFNNDKSGQTIDWVTPWIIYALSSAFNFFLQVTLAFFEGCNQIKTSQRIKIVDGLIQNGVAIVFLVLGFGLYSLSIGLLLGTIATFAQIIIYYHKTVIRFFKNRLLKDGFWLKDILSLLWKYAISWGAGYLIFQIYNPIVMVKYGSEAAGEVGYIITIVGAFVSIANVWSYVSVPKINMYSETKNWRLLDREYKKNLLFICGTFLLEVSCCVLFMYIYPFKSFFNKYIFSIVALLILCIGYFFQIIASYIGVYLRSHKKEPLMVLSAITAVVSTGLTITVLFLLPIRYVFLGFTTSVILSFPFTVLIKKKKQKEWHSIESETIE